MTDAPRDNNGVPVMLATSSADGVTVLALTLNPTTHGVIIEDNTTGSDLSTNTAKRDRNQVPVAMGTSNANGVLPVPLYINPATKELLVNSN